MPKNLIRRVLMNLDENYLPYEHFDSLNFFEDTEVLKGVTVKRLPSKIGLYFQSTLQRGVNIVEHYHNSEEYFYITKGKIILDESIELEEGDEYEFKSFELHKIKVIEECEMFVQFIKEDKRKTNNK